MPGVFAGPGLGHLVDVHRSAAVGAARELEFRSVDRGNRRGHRRRHSAAGVAGHPNGARAETERVESLRGADAVEGDLSAELGRPVGAGRAEMVGDGHRPSLRDGDVEARGFADRQLRIVGVHRGRRRTAEPQSIDDVLIRQQRPTRRGAAR